MSYERVTLGVVGPGNDLKQSDQALSVPDYKNSYSDLVIDNLHCIAQCCWRIFFAEPELPESAISGPSHRSSNSQVRLPCFLGSGHWIGGTQFSRLIGSNAADAADT